MKTCSSCNISKELTNFYPKMGRCKECHKDRCKAWAKAHPEIVAKARSKWRAKPGSSEKENLAARRWQQEHPEQAALLRKRHQVKLYGLTLEQFNEMERNQEGKCAICGEVPNRRLDIDHDHVTGKVRELLCSNHNTLIGLCNESVAILQATIDYLNKHKVGY